MNIFRRAIKKNSLPSNTNSETFIREQIKAYLISHGHLDHLSGFLLNTPNDKSGKFIIGLNETINIIQKSYFNNLAWTDFGPNGLKVIKR
jgi:cAMP phosphodiesterase